MLADDFIRFNRKTLEVFGAQISAEMRAKHFPNISDKMIDQMLSSSTRMLDDVMVAQRFVLSPHVVEAALDLARNRKAIDNSRDYFFTPAATTWIEWSGGGVGHAHSNRHAVLLTGFGEGNTKLVLGSGIYVFDEDEQRKNVASAPFRYDFPNDGALFHSLSRGASVDDTPESTTIAKMRKLLVDGTETIAEVDLVELGPFLAAALALINTPRISQIVEHDISRLNASRMKQNKVPLLVWRDVVIRPDSGWVSQSQARKTTGERKRHHVRTFFRLRKGKVEVVSPHWRGNREKGYSLHRHVVRMDAEEAGAWKGGPLPGPEIIKPDTDLSDVE